MLCSRLANLIFIVFFLSASNFEIFAFEQQVPEPFDRRKILDDLWSLLGLGLTDNNSRSPNPSRDTSINTAVTSNSSKFNTNNNSTTDGNNSIINDKNETYTINTATNITSITNLTDTNVTNGNNSEITASRNDAQGSTNSTEIISINKNGSFVEFKNETHNISKNSVDERNDISSPSNKSIYPLNKDLVNPRNNVSSSKLSKDLVNPRNNVSGSKLNEDLVNPRNNGSGSKLNEDLVNPRNNVSSSKLKEDLVNPRNNVSSSKLNEDLANLYNKTKHKFLSQQNQTVSNSISSLLSNSTITQTKQRFPPKPQVSENSSSLNCSVLPKFANTCQLPNEYTNQSDSLTTFADIETKMSNFYIKSYLLRYCPIGEWCLGSLMDNTLNESLNFNSKFCSSTFFGCLRSIETSYLSCTNYKKFKTISESLELICKYKQLIQDKTRFQSCGLHMIKLISVVLTDFERNASIVTASQDFCSTQKGFLMVSFNCLLTQCPEVFTNVLNGFDLWKWFTENSTEASQCPNYYECAFTATRMMKSTTTMFTNYGFGDIAARTSFNFDMTTKKYNLPDNKATLESQNEIKNDEKSSDSRIFKDNLSENTHIMASLSAMMVILMIGMLVMMVVCWKHLKKNSIRKRAGYSKLKTGEC